MYLTGRNKQAILCEDENKEMSSRGREGGNNRRSHNARSYFVALMNRASLVRDYVT